MNGYAVAADRRTGKPLRPYAKEQKRLFLTAMLIGVGMLMQVMGSNAVSRFLVSDEKIYNLYLHDEMFGLVMDMLYSSLCVFLPYAILFLLMRHFRLQKSIPLGESHDAVQSSLLVFGGLGLCFIVNSIVSYLYIILSSFGIESYTMQQDSELLTLTPTMLLLQVFRSALIPALFEEFAFRGVVLQPLRRYGDWFAILVSSFLFGMIHGNILQVPFAFMVGIILGYCAVVTGSLWCSIGIHFLNNFLALLQSVVLAAAGEQAATVYQLVISNICILVGAVCLILYVVRNRSFFRLRPSRFRYMPHKGVLVFLAPPVAIALSYYVYAVLMDVVGFYEWFSASVGNLFYYFSYGIFG